MTRSWRLLLLVPFFVLPVHAQDEYTEEAPMEEAAPADESAPAEEAPVEEAPADTGAEAYSQEAEAPAEDAASEEVEEPGEPWALYIGLDQVENTLSTSAGDADTGMYRLRIGRRIAESIGLEFQYGLDNSGDGPDEVETEDYMALMVVPTAALFETVELAFPVGYAKNSIDGNSLDGIAYGFAAELPLRVFGESLPDLRFGAGWMVYAQKGDARLYGANFGLRYDFTADGFGNPFAWIGNIDLWPFGDDDEPEEVE